MNAIGGQEILMPVVNPAEIWKETGRWYKIDAELGRFRDRTGREMALAMTHEEVTTDLVRKEIRSYRQLPQLVYHIQTKWRDDPRPRAGLIRGREFLMKDSYSLDTGWEGLEQQYRAHYAAYFNIFTRGGLSTIAVKSDVGIMGGKLAHEYMYLAPIGEDTLLLCDACQYAANRQIARFRKPAASPEKALAAQKVSTPGAKSIEDLAGYLGITKDRTAKAVFLMAELEQNVGNGGERNTDEKRELPSLQFVFAIVRGDMEVNETKLANAIRARSLRPATEDEIRAIGAVPGYASPVGLQRKGEPDFLVVVDDSIPASPNLVAGANEEGYHLLHVNYGRDYTGDVVTDIAGAQDGDACPECGSPLRSVRGVEVGNIFQLGTWFSEAMGAEFLDRDGQAKPVVMGSYGIGLTRMMACIAEEHHDDHGLIWPVTVAPFQVHLVLLSGKGQEAEMAASADSLYARLTSAGIEVLYDDREETPGVKFNDADLIGLPVRLTVSPRAQKNGGIEFKRRDQDERCIIPEAEVLDKVKAEIEALQNEIEAHLKPVEYRV
jgi:prolyl-tRNA synthetase